MPRRTAPVEVRRLNGRNDGADSGGRKLPDPANLVALPTASGVPRPPESLGAEGLARWQRVWTVAKWLSPDADRDVMVRLCQAEDMRTATQADLAEKGPWVLGSTGQQVLNPMLAVLQRLGDQMLRYETSLGLTPSARGNWAEVRPAGEIDESKGLAGILKQAAQRSSARQ